MNWISVLWSARLNMTFKKSKVFGHFKSDDSYEKNYEVQANKNRVIKYHYVMSIIPSIPSSRKIDDRVITFHNDCYFTVLQIFILKSCF